MATRDEWAFDAIGTAWNLSAAEPLTQELRDGVSDLIETFDRQWSRFRTDSTVSALAAGGSATLPADAAPMLDRYRELAEATAGAVNPLVGGALVALGYDAAYSFAPGDAEPAPTQWTDILTWDGELALAAPAVIDVGALGKGRLVDLVFAHIIGAGLTDVIVNASGDLRVSGSAVRVALEHPFDATRAIGVATLTDQALCASATNRRSWGRGIHHVLDARTGQPVDTIAATWVIHPDAMLADALATALFFDGGPQLAHAWDATWVRMYTDGRAEYRHTDATQNSLELFS